MNTMTDEELQRFRLMKEDAAERAAERGHDDMNGIVEVWRDDEPLLTIFTPNVDRDEALNAVWFAVPALNADRVVVAMDAHLTRQMENPTTGEPWKHGEMQKACHEDMMCRTGVITDCLIINDARRDGTYQMQTLAYHVDEQAKADGGRPVAVHWQPVGDESHVLSDDDPDARLEGIVPDAIRGAFERTLDVGDELSALEEEFTEVEARAAKDAACIARLVMEGYGVAFSSSDEEHAATVGRLLSGFAEAGIQMEEVSNAQDS